MGRLRWFIAGAAAAAGALVAAPDAYRRLRAVVEPVSPPAELPPGAPDIPAPVAPEPPAAAAKPAPLPQPDSEDTAELRFRIDETRARIQQKAQEAAAPAEGDPDA